MGRTKKQPKVTKSNLEITKFDVDDNIYTVDIKITNDMGVLEIHNIKLQCDIGRKTCHGHLGYELIYPTGDVILNKRYEISIVNKLLDEGLIAGPLDRTNEVKLKW